MSIKLGRWFRSSAFSVIGLTITVSANLLIFWYIFFETSFDTGNANFHRIYRISMDISANGEASGYAATGALVGAELVKKYPVFTDYASFRIINGKTDIKHNDRLYSTDGIYAVNKEVFNVFSCKAIEGSLNDALTNPGSVVLTQTLAEKVFGKNPCLNKVIELKDQPYVVSAVIKDIPLNADLRFNALVYDTNRVSGLENIIQSYFDTDYYTYVMGREGSRSPGMNAILDNYSKDFNELLKKTGTDFTVKFKTTPLSGLHFAQPLLMDTPKGNKNNLYSLLLLAVFLLLIGITNFVNFSIVKSYKTATSVGLKRLFGVRKEQIIWEFIRRSSLVVLVAVVISVIVVAILFRTVSALNGILFFPTIGQVLGFIAALTLLLIIIGSLGGIIPVQHMSGYSVAKLLKNKLVMISHNSLSHRVVLFLQLAISAGLIIFTMELYRQLKFFNNFNLGFEKENVLVADLGQVKNNTSLAAFKKNLLNQSGVEKVSFCQSIPGEHPGKEIFYVSKEGKKAELVYSYLKVDEDYFSLLGISNEGGRNFNEAYDDNALIVTKTFLNNFPLKTLQEIKIATDTTKEIVGVVKDFHQTSFHNPMEPLVFRKLNVSKEGAAKVLIKTSPGSLEKIRHEWQKMGFNAPFNYYFLSDFINSQYEKENRLLSIFVTCSLVAISLSFFGLFTILSIIIKNRKRELAIRIVLGGTLTTNFFLLFRPFAVLLPVVFLIVCPLVFYFIQQWRNNYAYSASTSVFPYLTTLTLIIILVSINVSYLLYRSLKVNITTLIRTE